LFINHQPVDTKEKNPAGVRDAINAALAEKPKSGADLSATPNPANQSQTAASK
jgi:hypothetical protein